MALRTIRVIGDPILEKETKTVKEVTDKTKELIRDMFDTMYDANGVGLAAPQVGILRQIFVVDIGDGKRFVCINPEVTPLGDEVQTGEEGCLSVPDKQGIVTRPMKVHVKAMDINFQPYEFDAEGLLARAMAHENDHLHGIMYVSKVEGELEDVEYEALDEGEQ
ncbi:MAG: peptide deformylase [Oribacterium sp.]|nr:peptide deformylase [Oribacterium sp.]